MLEILIICINNSKDMQLAVNLQLHKLKQTYKAVLYKAS